MSRTSKRALALALASVLLTAAVTPRAARAQDPSAEEILKPAKAALTTLVQYPRYISQARATVSGIFLGPGGYNVTCDYSCFIVCWKTARYSSQIDFSSLRNPLQSTLTNYESQSNQFTSYFNGRMQTWLKESVPAMSGKFENTSARLQQIQQQVSGGAVTVDAGKAQAAAELGGLADALQGGANELKQIMGQLAQFLEQQKANQREIANRRAQAGNIIENSFNQMNAFIDDKPCGQDDARNQFNAFKGLINGSLGTLDNTFLNLNNQTAAADQAGSVLLGTLVNFVTKYNFVAGQVRQAQNAEAVNQAIANLRLNVAAAAWKDFAGYAAKQM